jgi:hypothetical protein
MMSILEGWNLSGGRRMLGWAAPLGRMASTNYLALVHVRDTAADGATGDSTLVFDTNRSPQRVVQYCFAMYQCRVENRHRNVSLIEQHSHFRASQYQAVSP